MLDSRQKKGSGEISGAPWGATSATIHYGEGIGVEISDTWAQIIAATQDGTYKTKYHIHDYKTIDMGSEGIIKYEIVGIDKDVKANGNTVPLSFLAKSAPAILFIISFNCFVYTLYSGLFSSG